MISPGYKPLGSFTITAAGTQVGESVDIEGFLALTIKARFSYGSGGTNCKLYLQTSNDDENTWDDFACIVFNTAGEATKLNFSKLTPKLTQITPTDGAMSDDTAIDGAIDSKIRCKVVSAGTYAGSTVLTVTADAS